MANWKFSNEGQKLFEERLEIKGWSKLSDDKLSEQLRVYRSTVTKLRTGNYAGHKRKLENVMITLGLKVDEVTSESFARKYFQEVENSPKPQSDNKLEPEIFQREEITINSNKNLLIPNPFIPRSGTINDSEHFFGREKEVYDVFEAINSGDCVELLGRQRHIGKSSVLIQIKNLAITKY